MKKPSAGAESFVISDSQSISVSRTVGSAESVLFAFDHAAHEHDGSMFLDSSQSRVKIGLVSDPVARLWTSMPRKIRELIGDLELAGFVNRGGKGSHRNYQHPNGQRVTISGKTGDDAKPYQEREVEQAIEESQS
jgi:predicted RNA binding protein YcfA (HicA-like mRNA interferase family)